jgi:hypothetical protein
VERVLIGVRRAVERPERSGTEPLGAGPENVVVRQHVVETCVVRATNPIAQRVGVGTAVGLREDHTDLHRAHPFVARSVASIATTWSVVWTSPKNIAMLSSAARCAASVNVAVPSSTMITR